MMGETGLNKVLSGGSESVETLNLINFSDSLETLKICYKYYALYSVRIYMCSIIVNTT
jgi:hypothetical protein